MNKLLLALVLAVSMTGCASIKEAVCGKPDIIVPENKVIKVDPKLLEPCKALTEMALATPTWDDYLVLTGDNAIAYADCKHKQESSIQFIKEVGNIK